MTNAAAIKKRQKFALDHPLENPFTPPDAGYMRIETMGVLRIKTVLTVDPTDSGHFRWHASLSVLGADMRPINPFGNISVEEGEAVVLYLKKLLDGVGQGELAMTKPNPIYHMWKNVTENERLRIRRRSVSRN